MYIEKQLVRGELYARYCSIVQSSGMGKSRLLDELSKKYFMIPINLRSKATTGLSSRYFLQVLLNMSNRLPPPRQ
jgi:hypothetical protein